MTHYKTLGVTPDASHAEIKRAYRRLAMHWHPDRNDHPDATERFKEIRAAYGVLTSKDVDIIIDDSSSAQTENSASFSDVGRAPDIRLSIEISLAEGFSGCVKSVSYKRGHPCLTCEGTGEHGISRTRFCSDCHGSGRLRDKVSGLRNCDFCHGRGFFVERICPDCSGSGRNVVDVNLEVQIPAGMLSGYDLRLAGQGEPATSLLEAGDLFLAVTIQPDICFRLSGRDLQLHMPVNALSFLAGGCLTIPLPWGSTSIELATGEVAVREMIIRGLGYPGMGKNKPGDLHLVLRPVFPVNLDTKQIKALQQVVEIINSRSETLLPEVAIWWRQFSDRVSTED